MLGEFIAGRFKSVCEKKGYVFFDRGDYNLNLFGIRRQANPNTFDDFFAVIYKIRGKYVYHWFWATTDAGQFYLNNPIVQSGCALLKEGQYRGAYSIGLHQGKYEALRQVKPVTVHRDNNRNDEVDFSDNTETGLFGINIHRGSLMKSRGYAVDKWSAGCQVIESSDDFDALMRLCRTAADKYGNSFTYTLLNERDFADNV